MSSDAQLASGGIFTGRVKSGELFAGTSGKCPGGVTSGREFSGEASNFSRGVRFGGMNNEGPGHSMT